MLFHFDSEVLPLSHSHSLTLSLSLTHLQVILQVINLVFSQEKPISSKQVITPPHGLLWFPTDSWLNCGLVHVLIAEERGAKTLLLLITVAVGDPVSIQVEH